MAQTDDSTSTLSQAEQALIDVTERYQYRYNEAHLLRLRLQMAESRLAQAEAELATIQATYENAKTGT